MHAPLHVVAACLGLMFFVAAFAKVDGWPRWTEATNAFFPLQPRVSRFIRFTLPLAEAIVGVFTFVRPVIGLVSGSLLLLAFAGGVLWLTPRSRAATCNCFGALMPTEIGPGLAARNAVLGVTAGLCAFLVARSGAPVFRPVEGLLLVLCGANVLVVTELSRLPRQLLRGASEMKPREP
jgi:Methylamine utilisation protein MauE